MPKAKPEKTSRVKTPVKKSAVKKPVAPKSKDKKEAVAKTKKSDTKSEDSKKRVNEAPRPMSKAKIKAEATLIKQVATIKNSKIVTELWDDYGKDPG